MNHSYSREIDLTSVHNFRDLGGYKTGNGSMVGWRKLFRSSDLNSLNRSDLGKLRNELGITSVLNLKSSFEIEHHGMGLLADSGIKCHNVALISNAGKSAANKIHFSDFSNLGDYYFGLAQQQEFGQRIVEALKIIADPANQPLVFHCTHGKDRTGILSAVVLGILEVNDGDIISDYCLTAPYIKEVYNRIKNQPQSSANLQNFPEYFWTIVPGSMVRFLSALKQEYGSIRQYVMAQGADMDLVNNLPKTLLTE